MENENVNIDLIRGHVDTIILSSIFEEDKYGLQILNFIKEKSNSLYALKQPTLYSCLKRLEKLGHIRSYKGEISNGAQRVYYALEQSGRDLVLKDKYQWEFSRTIINNLLSDKAFNPDEQAPPFNPSNYRPLTRRQSQKYVKDDDFNQDDDDQSFDSENIYNNGQTFKPEENSEFSQQHTNYSNTEYNNKEYSEDYSSQPQNSYHNENIAKTNNFNYTNEEDNYMPDYNLNYDNNMDDNDYQDDYYEESTQNYTFNINENENDSEKFYQNEQNNITPTNSNYNVDNKNENIASTSPNTVLAQSQQNNYIINNCNQSDNSISSSNVHHSTLADIYSAKVENVTPNMQSNYSPQPNNSKNENTNFSNENNINYANSNTSNSNFLNKCNENINFTRNAPTNNLYTQPTSHISQNIKDNYDNNFISQVNQSTSHMSQNIKDNYDNNFISQATQPTSHMSQNSKDNNDNNLNTQPTQSTRNAGQQAAESINYISSFSAIYNNQPKVDAKKILQTQINNTQMDLEYMSLSELKNKMLSQGITLKPYYKKNTSSFFNNKYYYKNKVGLYTSLIFYAMVLFQILIIHFSTRASLGTPNGLIWLGIILPLVYPIWSLIKFALHPTLKTSAKFNPKSILNTSFIFLINAGIVIVVLAFLVFKAEIGDAASLVRPLIIPLSMLINIPIAIGVYYLLYITKKFHVN